MKPIVGDRGWRPLALLAAIASWFEEGQPGRPADGDVAEEPAPSPPDPDGNERARVAEIDWTDDELLRALMA